MWVVPSASRWVSNHGMPDWIQRNEDVNYLQEGRDLPRAWKTIAKSVHTHGPPPPPSLTHAPLFRTLRLSFHKFYWNTGCP